MISTPYCPPQSTVASYLVSAEVELHAESQLVLSVVMGSGVVVVVVLSEFVFFFCSPIPVLPPRIIGSVCFFLSLFVLPLLHTRASY